MFGFLVSRMLPLVPRGIVRRVAMRYVAGETLGAAVATVADLNRQGYEATLDVLGEDAKDGEHADAAVVEYLRALAEIADAGLKSNVSVKLTHLGLRLGREACEARLGRIVEAARERGNRVRIDMEDSGLTDVTLDVYRTARERFGNVGTVLQAYLRRTRNDATKLAAEGANLRLCKGIYREPAAIAFQGREEIRQSYLDAAEILLKGEKSYVGFATHDRVLLDRCRELVRRLGVGTDRYEFQALLGVPVEDVLERFVAEGIRVRWYVPFGVEWYPYATRRLKENPKIASYVFRQIFSRGRKTRV
jgi:proline dehydrogenase